ncbi:response regulator [Variovorax sp. OV084]|uniref:response regulator n=1 Tax=Variovorax sp. OV084 TaxID=1882777 RepID=UPI0008BCA039|nr:response regulator transcription factor [Variovorax sp. OV084]SET70395.1 Response regulator receiver domain-containing protein [Variovorax sp. OV084]
MFDTKLPGGALRVFRPQPFFSALVVESDPAVASRLNSVLGVLAPGRCVVLVPTREEADAMLDTLSFDLVFVDMQLYPIGDGASLIADVRAMQPRARIIALSDTDDRDLALSAFASGATGYLLSEAEDAEIAYALRALANGGAVLDPRVARHVVAMFAETLAEPIRAGDFHADGAFRKLELRSLTPAIPEGTRPGLPG